MTENLTRVFPQSTLLKGGIPGGFDGFDKKMKLKNIFYYGSQSAREHTKPLQLFSENVLSIGNDFSKVWKCISDIFTSCVGTYLSNQKHEKPLRDVKYH